MKEKWFEKNEFFEFIEEEKLIINIESGVVHHLNDLGVEILDLIEKNKSFDDVILLISDKYRIDKITVREDVTNFLYDIEEKKYFNILKII